MIKKLYLKYKEIINYLVFGVLSTIVNFTSYYLFARIFKIEEVTSSGLSWICAVLFAYITNKIFVFESKTNGVKELLVELFKFILARIISGTLGDIGLFALMVKVLKINDMFSKIVTQFIVVVLNYIFSKLIIFKKAK